MSSISREQRAFFDLLDEMPCTATGVLLRTPRGETRHVRRDVFAREFRRAQESRVARFPRRERARNLLGIFSYQLEKEER